MPRVRGLPEPRLDGLIGEVEALVMRALRAVGRAAARLLGSGGPPSADDLAVVPVVWGHYVDTVFTPVIAQVWSESSGHLAAELVAVGYEDGAALTPSASDYLAVARNRLRDVGDEVWETLREDLAEGVAAGEGVEELALRIAESAGVGQARAERIARTEVIAASNAASLAVANLANLPGATKEWMSTPDARTRPEHRLADGQRVPLGTPFEVGGSELRFPGDPDGAADLVVNCRCSIGYVFGDDVSDSGDALTAAAEVHTGAMIALIPSEEDAARLAVEGGEPADELHTTLLYLGDAADYPEVARAQIIGRLQGLIEDAIRPDYTMPVVAEGFAVSLFNPPGMERADGKDRDSCIVLGLGGEDLSAVRGLVVETVREVEAEPAGFALPEQHDPWTPHITLIYTDDVERAAALTDRVGPVVLDRIRVAFAGEHTDIPLAVVSAEDSDAEATEDDDFDWESHIAESIRVELQSRMPAHLQRYWIRRLQLGTPGSFRRCVAQLRQHYPQNTEGLCANLYHEATGRWPGRKKDGADAGLGEVALPALADETTLIEEVDVAEPVAVEVDPLAILPGEHWHAFANIEEISTGMRMFSEGALTWRNLPFAFHWQYESSAHGGQAKTAHIGLVTRVERIGPEIHVWGALDLGSERGREYGRRLVEQWERWVSIGLDESFRESDIEYLYPETFDPDVDDPMDVEAEEMVIHAGRIGEVTGVSVPAQQEATIEATPELMEAMAALVAATRPHDEAQHPRGFGGKWVRKGSGDGVTTDVPTSDGGHVAVDADDDGRVGVGVDSESGRSTATLAPQSAADLAEVMRGGLGDGEEVIVEDGDDRVSLSREGDVYQLDVGADSTVMAEADLPAVADTISEAVGGSDESAPDGEGGPLEEASAGDMDLSLLDDGSVDVEWGDGGFNVAADELAPLTEAFAEVADSPESDWPLTRTAGGFTVTVDEAGDVELTWGFDGEGAAFDLDETDALASALQQLSARWDEEIADEVEIDMEEPMAASAATQGEGRRRLASVVVRRTRKPTVIVAAGHTITLPEAPPATWFDEPADADLPPYGSVRVDANGRLIGLLAPAQVNHRSFPDKRVKVPMGNVDYSGWQNKSLHVAEGHTINVGVITMDCGHASTTPGDWSYTHRREHYDNTCSIAARARAYEKPGIGVALAGAIAPWLDAEGFEKLLSSDLSGDWPQHPDKPGWRDFIAALAVPVGGFPNRAKLRLADGQLVAAAVPVQFDEDEDAPVEMVEKFDLAEGARVRVDDPSGDATEGEVIAVHAGPAYAIRVPGRDELRWHVAEDLEVVDAAVGEPVEVEGLAASAADLAPVMDRLARTVGLDWKSRMAKLRDRVSVNDRP